MKRKTLIRSVIRNSLICLFPVALYLTWYRPCSLRRFSGTANLAVMGAFAMLVGDIALDGLM